MQVKLLVCVVRGYDVPGRADQDPVAGPAQSGLVSSYVEASFQGCTVRTGVAEGCNPAWNHQLELPFRPPNNDFSPGVMRAVQDSLHLHLFDLVRQDLLEDERERGSRVHARLESRWLGGISLPFSSLYQNTRVEGTFRLHSPPVLLGYERAGLGAGHGGWGGAAASPTEQDREPATFINLYLTLQPALNVPEPVREKLDCEEGEAVVGAAERWQLATAAAFSHRATNPLVIDTAGRAVLMTRYLRGLAPPPDLLARAEVEFR